MFGREITQILLIHANDINTDCPDELLKRLAARGYRFVTLDQAMEDQDIRPGRNNRSQLAFVDAQVDSESRVEDETRSGARSAEMGDGYV